MKIVDSHCHLDLLEQKGFSVEEVVNNARNNGVKYMQSISVEPQNIENILKITDQYEDVYASYGLHPCYVNSDNLVTSDNILERLNHPKIIGIGETGLDYYRQEGTDISKLQIKSFEQHIEASINYLKLSGHKVPVIVHMREAEEDTYDILSSYSKQHEFPFLIHCFTASHSFASKVLDLGGYISLAGIVTFKNAKDLQEIAKSVPLQRLLLETDSPYLAPRPYRGKVNEPAYVKHTAEFLSKLLNV